MHPTVLHILEAVSKNCVMSLSRSKSLSLTLNSVQVNLLTCHQIFTDFTLSRCSIRHHMNQMTVLSLNDLILRKIPSATLSHHMLIGSHTSLLRRQLLNHSISMSSQLGSLVVSQNTLNVGI